MKRISVFHVSLWSPFAGGFMKLLGHWLLVALILQLVAAAQNIAPPAPQRFQIHSQVLNEDRVIWVRTPAGYERSKAVYPVVYQTDAPGHINEMGSSADFLVTNDRMPQVIIVAIANTDRTRDLTPTRADEKNPDGTSVPLPTSGGAD